MAAVPSEASAVSDIELKVSEHDEAGKLTGCFVWSKGDRTQTSSRVDLIPPSETKSLWQRTLDVFLPAGYPYSVTKDYLEYQIYDSLQAFASSIAGLLASRAALSSVGVGDSTASPTAALLLSILQESAGRIATILFAYRFGSALEPECKMYRLLADVLNDIGFVLDCLSPVFPKHSRVVILSSSSVLRALCGVAAGSAKASLSAHFAKWSNLGELSAKDSSQETVISLMGMLVGGLVVSWVTTPFATWTVLILLLSIHLETNRRAVRAVSMRTLNRQRATLVYHHLRNGHVPTPDEISSQEYIFERGGILRGVDRSALGYCNISPSFAEFLRLPSSGSTTPYAFSTLAGSFSKVLQVYEDRGYILSASMGGRRRNFLAQVVVKQGASSTELLIAWWQGLIIASETSAAEKPEKATKEKDIQHMSRSLRVAVSLLRDNEPSLRAVGWDLDTNALEVTSGSRVVVES